MARLPIPGGDTGNWGTILNDFLSQSLNSDGSLKSSAAPVQSVDGSTGAVSLTNTYAPISQTINAQTGTTYTLVLSDAGKLITLSNGSAITLTVPANSSVEFPVGTRIDLAQIGAGQVTVAITSDTLNSTPGLKFRAQYSGATLVKTASTTWLLFGDLSA